MTSRRPASPSRSTLAALLAAEDLHGLRLVTFGRPWPVLRFLMGRVYSEEPAAKWRAVHALGALVQTHGLLSDDVLRELMRRFIWALSDESGAVPFGIPEAMGEVLAQRPALQAEYLPILCAQITSDELQQTGAIAGGVIWALGRIGPAAATACPQLRVAIQRAADAASDPETRATATWALAQLDAGGAPPAPSTPHI